MDNERYDLKWESKNKLYSIWVHKHTDILVIVLRDGSTEWPIQYAHSGKIAYDNPYRVPQYVKDQVYKIYASLKE